MKRLTYINKVLVAASLFMATSAVAQQADNTFKVMTLNVDGLPKTIMVFNVNEDGPGSAGSELISEYIAKKDCDIVGMQENFNYRWEIWSRLFAGYEHDEWSGGVMTEETKIDYAHLHRNKMLCDGLNLSWKKEYKTTTSERVAWKKSFGKFSHEFDDMVTKGFRRYEITLENGAEVVVYNMHMDASSDRDEQAANDAKDIESRQSQWEQLRDYIVSNMDQRPIIVMGDMNSLYHRDDAKKLFIDNINTSGKAIVSDAWVELKRNGSYPEYGQTEVKDDLLDKVLYINPTGTETPITPVLAELDETGYQNDGKPLGDHYPLIVTFSVAGTTAIGHVRNEAQQDDAPAYTVQGTRATANQKGIVIKEGRKFVNK